MKKLKDEFTEEELNMLHLAIFYRKLEYGNRLDEDLPGIVDSPEMREYYIEFINTCNDILKKLK